MIYNKHGQSVELDGVIFTVGMDVRANANSDYANLYGVITEIRTGDDRETENDTPDIYCCFDSPVMPDEVREMEERFSSLYGMPKKIEDLSLDMVIMGPDMLEPLDDLEKDRILLPMYVVVYDWHMEMDGDCDEYAYMQLEDARRKFHQLLAEEQEEGLIAGWQDRADFTVQSETDYYDCWLEGEYCQNHYRLSIEKMSLVANRDMLKKLLECSTKGCENEAH